MKRFRSSLIHAGAVALAIAAGCGSAQAPGAYDPYDLSVSSQPGHAVGYATGDASGVMMQVTAVAETAESAPRRAMRSDSTRSRESAPMMAEASWDAGPQMAPAIAPPPPPVESTPAEQEPTSGQLLIYTASLTLAIYDVTETQARALALVEEMGGYAAQRADSYIQLRVPAARFREALEALGALGDVQSLSWDAQDVTEEFLDVEIRLRNARDMRERLAALLDEAIKVTDALAIEAELQRVTLEIEQLEGRRRSLADRISLATISVYFSQRAISQVPGEEYRLPFQWLNQIGVERLLRL